MDIKAGDISLFSGLVNATTPGEVFSFFDDFTEYAAGDWTVTTTEAGSSSATEAIVTDGSYGPHGVLLISNDNATDDFDELQGPEIVKLEDGKPVVFKCRVRINDTGLAEWFAGLSITDTDPLEAGALESSDYIGFYGGPTEAAADKLIFTVGKNATAATASDTASETSRVTIADATWYELAFCYDGVGTARGFVDGVCIGELTTHIPDDEYLAVTLAINNSTAVIRTMAADYVGIWQYK